MAEQNKSVNSSDNISTAATEKLIKITMQETSSEDSTRESSSCCKDSSDSLSENDDTNMCMSPPKSRTKRSNSRRKKHRNTSKKSGRHQNDKQRPPSLMHSTELTKNDADSSQLSDSLNNQNPQISIIKSVPSAEPTVEFIDWSKISNCSETIVKKSSKTTSKTTYEYRIKKSNNIDINDINPLDRQESINKINLLLKLALRPRIPNNKDFKSVNLISQVPPSTPSSSIK